MRDICLSRGQREIGKYIIKYIKLPISMMNEMRFAIPTNIHLAALKTILQLSITQGTVTLFAKTKLLNSS